MRYLLVLALGLTACGYDYLGRDVQVVYAPQSDAAVLTMTGPIVTSRFPETVAESSRSDASVFVMDVTDGALTHGQFVGIVATYDETTLTVRGPFAAAACGDFAFVILDNVRDAAADARIGRAVEFDNAFEGKGPFGELRNALVNRGVELASVAGATLFSVPCP